MKTLIQRQDACIARMNEPRTSCDQPEEVMKIEIKCRFSGSVLFAHEQEDNTVKLTVEAAVKAGANLAGANLAGANLDGAYLARAYLARAYLARANLDGANLDGANLDGANLARANLAGANLDGANLARANLAGANLDGAYLARAYLARANLARANLARANLDGAYLARAYLARANLARANLDGANLDGGRTLKGERPILQIGPIGSRSAYLVAYITDSGVCIRAGCFFGTAAEFAAKVAEEHGDNHHAQEYAAALKLIETHAAMWTPSVEAHEQQPETEASA